MSTNSFRTEAHRDSNQHQRTNQRSLDSLFDSDIRDMGRIRFDRSPTIIRHRLSEPSRPTPNQTNLPSRRPLQRQLIDEIGKRNPRSRWTINIGSRHSDHIVLSDRDWPKRYLSINWGYLKNGDIGYVAGIYQDSAIEFFYDDNWIPVPKNSRLFFVPNQRLLIHDQNQEHIIELPDPNEIKLKLMILHRAYDYFDIPIDCDKTLAKTAYRRALLQTHPDMNPDLSPKEVKKVIRFWKILKWYNGW